MRRRAHLVANRAHRGQTLVLFALAQLVLLAALGLAIDGGYLFVQRRAMQNAADAATMAGAQAIAQNLTDTEVTAAAVNAAARNGVTDAVQVTCRFFTNSYPAGTIQACSSTGTAMSALATAFTGVEVRVAEQHATFVLRAVGTPEAGTAATAAAQVQTAGKITVGPFVVCAIDTAVYSAPASYKGGGIFVKNGIFPDSGKPSYIRNDGYDNCGGYSCAKTAVNSSTGGPQINPNAYAYLDASLTPIKNNQGNNAVGPVFLIHAPNGISVCNDNSSSFKGINTNTTVVAAPNGQGYWAENAFAPIITTGNITSVQATVEGINGCVAGAALDNCIMILPIVDNSGPGGTGSNAALAWRMLGAFYIKELSNGQHSGALIKNYTIVGDGSAIFVPGAQVPTTITLIK